MQKSPTKARFIIAAAKCSVKPLLKAVTAELKLIYNQIEHYKSTLFWCQNTLVSLEHCHRHNSRNKAISISMFDFSTLYTNIPYHKLVSVMSELINFCFDGVVKSSFGSLSMVRSGLMISKNKTSLVSN